MKKGTKELYCFSKSKRVRHLSWFLVMAMAMLLMSCNDFHTKVITKGGCKDKDKIRVFFVNESPNEIVEITIRHTEYEDKKGESKPYWVYTRLKQLRPGEGYEEECVSSSDKFEIAGERIIDEVTEENVYNYEGYAY